MCQTLHIKTGKVTFFFLIGSQWQHFHQLLFQATVIIRPISCIHVCKRTTHLLPTKRLGPPSLHLSTSHFSVVAQPCTQSKHPSAPIHILSTLVPSPYSSMQSSDAQVQLCEAHKLHLRIHFVSIYTLPISIYWNTKFYCWGTIKKMFYMKPRIYLESYCQAVTYFPLRKVCSGRQSK